MRFVILLAEDDPEAWLTADAADMERVFAQHRAFDEAVAARGSLESGAALAPGVRTLHGAGDERGFTDGPFAEAVEQVTGLYVVDLPARADVEELAALLPEGYTVSVHAVAVLEGY